MKIIKWIVIAVLGAVVALILGLELFYFYAVNKLELEEIDVKR